LSCRALKEGVHWVVVALQAHWARSIMVAVHIRRSVVVDFVGVFFC
jgi:hypothetical protein